MITLFARLKLRLLRNSLRTSAGLGLVLFTILGTIGGSSLGLTIARISDADRSFVLPILATVLTIGWTFGPVLFGASDETIDTTRLALYPLDTRRLAMGMTVAALLGPGPLTAGLVVGGGILAAAEQPATLPLAAIAALLVVAIAATSSKLLLTFLGTTLRQRRTRDLATFATGFGIAVLALGLQAISSLGGRLDRSALTSLAHVLRWLPVGWAGDALGRASRGELVVPAVQVLGAAAFLALLVALWGRLLARSLTEVTEHVADEEAARGSWLVRWLDARTGAGRGSTIGRSDGDTAPARPGFSVLAKELRYFQRHPRYRVQVVSQATVLLIGGAPFIGAIIQQNPEAVLFGCIPGLTAGVTGSNLLGPDGRSLWAEWMVLPTLRPVLRGRSIAFAALGLASALVVTIGAAAWTGGWRFAPAAIGAAIGMAFTGSGVGTITSVFAPSPFPEDNSPNPFATASPGAGCLTAVFTMTGVVTGLLLSAPILVGLAYTRDSALTGGLVAGLAPLYGAAVWMLTTNRAARRADAKAPELIALLS